MGIVSYRTSPAEATPTASPPQALATRFHRAPIRSRSLPLNHHGERHGQGRIHRSRRHGLSHGRHIAQKGGHDVTVYNRTAAKAEKWVAEHGGRAAPTPTAAAEGADFVFSCVGNDDDLRSVTLGADGAFAGMKTGAIFIDNTTASATVARELVRRRRRRRAVGFLDAPVSGGQAGAENGQLTVMVGGDQDDFRQGQAGHRRLRQDGRADGAGRRRPAHQDGQPDLHRRPRPGARRGHPFRQDGRASTSRR